MTISSAGVGSGLDVQSIVSQLVAIERQPLTALKTTATKIQTQLSLYGSIKSQVATLGDAAALLATSAGWSAQKATSSNSAAVAVTAGSSAVASALTVSVQQLAQAQAVTSTGVATGAAVGATGTLSIQLGTWTGASFAAGSGAAVSVTVAATDSVSTIAAAINAANAGVTASVLNDGSSDRLVLRSSSTGAATGFSVTPTGNAALAAYGFTNSAATVPSASGMFMGQSGQNAELEVNGVALSSASNAMNNVIAGVSLQLLQETTAAVDITVTQDTDTVEKNIQSFVTAYNALNQTIADATKYSAATKTGGALQGDATTLGLQSALRSMLGSSSTGSSFTNLSQVGIERQTDGSLKINSTKLNSAKLDMSNLQKLFTTNNNDAATNGFGLKVRDFSRGLISFDGRVTNKTSALQSSITRNTADQDKVNERATRVEAQLLRQYSALDTQVAQWTNLNSYITSQIAQWNKSTS